MKAIIEITDEELNALDAVLSSMPLDKQRSAAISPLLVLKEKIVNSLCDAQSNPKLSFRKEEGSITLGVDRSSESTSVAMFDDRDGNLIVMQLDIAERVKLKSIL